MSFAGTWLVREYVFDAEGALLGTVRQRRALERLDDHRLRLTQDCTPDTSLADHPMSTFAGTHVFDLALEGTRRRYLGPAVIGVGQSLGETAMWGEGVWPEFGHAFQSYAFSGQDKQLTGGRFADGSTLVAQIAGIARPDTGGPWPELTGPFAPAEVASHWQGDRTVFHPSGSPLERESIQRVYEGDSWREQASSGTRGAELTLRDRRLLARVEEPTGLLQGVSRRYGWLLEHDWAGPTGSHVRGFEALDAAGAEIMAIYRRYQDQQLERIEVLHLRPQETT
ncbi:MAG TPA: hypothetical protein DIU15_05130 [Deltaproteobacteria bacterium]|nr:hypothetical protein [Deltaproteobacteria bacterium]HCP45400.1 hypothetical protein [Deltaproteobacteria bacterium]